MHITDVREDRVTDTSWRARFICLSAVHTFPIAIIYSTTNRDHRSHIHSYYICAHHWTCVTKDIGYLRTFKCQLELLTESETMVLQFYFCCTHTYTHIYVYYTIHIYTGKWFYRLWISGQVCHAPFRDLDSNWVHTQSGPCKKCLM